MSASKATSTVIAVIVIAVIIVCIYILNTDKVAPAPVAEAVPTVETTVVPPALTPETVVAPLAETATPAVTQ